jgi:hypothetical protein
MPVLDIQTRTPNGRFAFEILAPASRTKASHPATTYSDIFDLGEWEFLQLLLDVYATSVTDSGDYLDVSIEMSTNKVLYYKVGAFTQLAGDGVASRHLMTFTTAKAVNDNAIFAMVAAAAVVDEKTFGRYMRAGVAVTDNGSDAIHQFKLTGYIK